MKKNPYKTLNVAKDATAAEIKKAYKKAAKEKHPDTGGSKEEFTILSSAYALLCNPDKRAYFDEHGEEQPQDNIFNMAVGIINHMIDEMFKSLDDSNIGQVDIIKQMTEMVNVGLMEIQQGIMFQNSLISKLDGLEKIFNKQLKHKKSATQINFFLLSTTNKKKIANKNILDLKNKEIVYDKTLELLGDFEFEVHHSTNINWGHLGNIFNATTTGAV